MLLSLAPPAWSGAPVVGADPLTDLGWLAGCWASEGAEAGSVEHWMAPAGGTMLGMARTVRDGRTMAFEWLRIVAAADGSLTYRARPDGAAETIFALVDRGFEFVAFANPGHDFPQRIEYRRTGDRLEARISGEAPEGPRSVRFPLQRVACPGHAPSG